MKTLVSSGLDCDNFSQQQNSTGEWRRGGGHWTYGFSVKLVDFPLDIFGRQARHDVSPAVEVTAVWLAGLQGLRNAVDVDAESEGDSDALGTREGQIGQGRGNGNSSSS